MRGNAEVASRSAHSIKSLQLKGRYTTHTNWSRSHSLKGVLLDRRRTEFMSRAKYRMFILPLLAFGSCQVGSWTFPAVPRTEAVPGSPLLAANPALAAGASGGLVPSLAAGIPGGLAPTPISVVVGPVPATILAPASGTPGMPILAPLPTPVSVAFAAPVAALAPASGASGGPLSLPIPAPASGGIAEPIPALPPALPEGLFRFRTCLPWSFHRRREVGSMSTSNGLRSSRPICVSRSTSQPPCACRMLGH